MFYVIGGALAPNDPSYVVRHADEELFACLKRGELCYVLDTRQVGKSSLLSRTAARLEKEGWDIAQLDISALGSSVSPEQWYFGLLYRLAVQLGDEEGAERVWLQQQSLALTQRWFAVLNALVERRQTPLFLFLDEIDAVRRLTFSADEFFAGIRAFQQEQYIGHTPGKPFQIAFCLAGSATPLQLIADARSTPFNIGTRIELIDFTLDDVRPLAKGFATASSSTASLLLRRILYWTGGQPYLTQSLCRAVSVARITTPRAVDRICAEVFFTRQAGEIDSNLSFVGDRILRGGGESENSRSEILALYAQLLRRRRGIRYNPSYPWTSLLLLAGVAVVREGRLVVRNRIYRRLFGPRWVRENLPDAEHRRQKQAVRAGVLRASFVWSLLLLAICAAAWQASVAHIAGIHALTAAVRADQAEKAKRALDQETTQARFHLLQADRAAITMQDRLGRLRTREAKAYASLLSVERRQAVAERRLVVAQRDIAVTRRDRAILQTGLKFAERKAAAEAARGRAYAQEIARKNGLVASALAARRGNEFAALEFGIRAVELAQRLGKDPDRESFQGLADAVNVGVVRRLRLEHSYALTSCGASRDGSKIVLAGTGPLAFVYDSRSGALLQTLRVQQEGQNVPVDAAVISPDGRWIVTGSASTITVWDAHRPKKSQVEPARTLHLPYLEVCALAFFPDSRHLLSAGPKGTVCVWDIENGTFRELNGHHDGYIWSVAVDSDGKHVATAGNDGLIRVWDVATGLPVADNRAFAESMLAFHSKPAEDHGALCVRFSQDTLVCTGKDMVAFTWIWNRQLYHRYYLGHLDWVGTADANANLILTGGRDRQVNLWNRGMTTPPIFRLNTHAGDVSEVHFLGGWRDLLTASSDGSAELWHITQPFYLNSGSEMKDAGYVPKGKALFWAGGDGVVQILDAKGNPRKTIFQTDSAATCVAFSPDARYLTIGDSFGRVRIYPAQDGKPIVETGDMQVLHEHHDPCVSVAFTLDGSRIISVSTSRKPSTPNSEGQVWCGEARSGQQCWSYSANSGIYKGQLSPDNKQFALACKDGSVRLLNAERGAYVSSLSPEKGDGVSEILCVAYSPDKRWIAGGRKDGNVYLWDAASGALVGKLLRQVGAVDSLCFSPDGKRLATACEDGVLRLWACAAESEQYALGRPPGPALVQVRGHIGGVVSVRFSPDGEELLTAGRDGTVRRFPATVQSYLRRARQMLLLRPHLTASVTIP